MTTRAAPSRSPSIFIIVSVFQEDFDMVEYIIELREACLDAYSGVLNGLKGENESVSNPDLAGILPHVGFMINFIAVIQADEEKSDALINSAVGLIG